MPRTLTASELAELMWNTVVINDMFDEKLAPVRDALRNECKRLVGVTVVADEDAAP